MLILGETTEAIIGAAIEVHQVLGPGLLEAVYEECLCYELGERGLKYDRQVALPVKYKSAQLDCGYRMDIVVQDQVVLELKCVETLLPVHEAQLLTYLRPSRNRVGLLINFYVARLREGGIVRRVR